MFIEHFKKRDERGTLEGARELLSSLKLAHSFECSFETTDDFGGKPAAFLDFYPVGDWLAKDHKKFGGLCVRVWLFGEPLTATYGLFMGAERAEQSEPRRGVAYTRERLGAALQTFEQSEGFAYHTWTSGNFPWTTKSSRAVARQLEQFISFRKDSPNAKAIPALEERIGKAVLFLDGALESLKPISEFGKAIIQAYYSDNLPETGEGREGADAVSPMAISGRAGDNIIFFGPPGTGKSHAADEMAGTVPEPIRVLFHPEYTYNDFVGLYRPVVGSDTSSQIESYDGTERSKPVCYFDFVPGPLLRSLAKAFHNPSQHVFLVIDEINRGDCAAIFGDIFQLLDRLPDGGSKYGITVRQEVAAWFNVNAPTWKSDGEQKLRFPRNFTILATMNTSDQSLLPMDSAFKRRWQWRSCNLDFAPVIKFLGGKRPELNDAFQPWDWVNLVELLNETITRFHLEDKQIGPWFIAPAQGTAAIDCDAFANKCLYYLWHDVFKDDQFADASPFKTGGDIRTFQQLQAAFYSKGLKGIFKEELLNKVGGAGETPAAQPEQVP